MKTTLTAVILLFSLFIVSCKESPTRKPGSSGKAFDIFVVIPEEAWQGVPGDTLRAILTEEMPIVNQSEEMYTLYYINPLHFKDLVSRHRNVLTYRTGEKYKEPAMEAEYDAYAQPQLVVHVTGPSDSVTVAYMSENREALQRIFEIAERDRFANSANHFPDPTIQKITEEDFGLKISIPKGYRVRSQHPNFLWVSYETPMTSQGIFIYKYPLTDRLTFTPEYLLEKRDEFAALIPGPNPGTYMKTSEVMTPVLSSIYMNDRLWFVSSGFWDVKNGFMGGPFTSYTTVNGTTREVITIDTYVYSPRNDKRNYVRQLEAIIYTARVLGDSTSTVRLPEMVVEEEAIDVKP